MATETLPVSLTIANQWANAGLAMAAISLVRTVIERCFSLDREELQTRRKRPHLYRHIVRGMNGRHSYGRAILEAHGVMRQTVSAYALVVGAAIVRSLAHLLGATTEELPEFHRAVLTVGLVGLAWCYIVCFEVLRRYMKSRDSAFLGAFAAPSPVPPVPSQKGGTDTPQPPGGSCCQGNPG